MWWKVLTEIIRVAIWEDLKGIEKEPVNER